MLRGELSLKLCACGSVFFFFGLAAKQKPNEGLFCSRFFWRLRFVSFSFFFFFRKSRNQRMEPLPTSEMGLNPLDYFLNPYAYNDV